MDDAPSWLEVSLLVNGEMAEAVAEVLSRFAPGGVVIESTQIIPSDTRLEGEPAGPLRVAAYISVDRALEDTRQRLEEALWYLSRISPLPAAQFRLVQETDWAEAWKEHYRPIAIGQKLIIVPAWLESPDPDRVAIRIDPGMAFGTGTHPTTQMCLEWIEELAPALPSPRAMIDIGCGSAILSIAALKLGVEAALGVDVDLNAVKNARKNARVNEITSGLELGQGSVEEILNGDFGVRQAPLVVANILTPIILRLFDMGLAKLVTPGGSLLLSGILEEQTPQIETALKQHGLTLAGRHQIDDWVALHVRKRA